MRRRLLAPEVVQTSAMDCGPASLKCLLEGFGIRAAYGRLREACQTDLDGTSIDSIEEAAGRLGLEADQLLLPVDHLLLPATRALPAIVVVARPNGLTHFVVAWRRHGPFVQLMDPARGRRWTTAARFLDEVYVHSMPVPAAAWREHAASEEGLAPLRARLERVVPASEARRLLADAASDPGWRSLAALDAAMRLVESLAAARALRRGGASSRALAAFFERARAAADGSAVAESFWTVRPASPAPDGTERVSLRGAVVVRVRGRRATRDAAAPPTLELAAALSEPPERPFRALLGLLLADGAFAPAALAGAIALAAAGVLVEALLFRGLLDAASQLGPFLHRVAAIAAVAAAGLALGAIELPIASRLLRVGRRLEIRLRRDFLRKLPLLGDRYFRSRLTSDMAERSHVLHTLRALPTLGGRIVRGSFALAFTVAGIAWLDPPSAPLAIAAAALSVALPLLSFPALAERDLRLRAHAGALARFDLDALLGLLPVRAHGAERALRREQEGLLREWTRAGLDLQRTAVAAEAAAAISGFGLAAWLLFEHVGHASGGSVLLLVYWALNVPALGQEIALAARQIPLLRNVALRALEPLGAPAESVAGGDASSSAASASTGAVAIRLERVSVRAAGHSILEEIDLEIEPGTHVAVVGPSGAGKSSLVGLLLGWHRPSTGRVLVDGEPLEAAALERLRADTAWVDPAVALWNRTLLENLRYGAEDRVPVSVGTALAEAELQALLAHLPDGLQTPLGEGGALVSGGEGQRVRFGRALHRPGVRLAILDEPFRGLDRARRRALLERARARWREATLLCITHDVGETLAFPRVLVVDAGRVVEDGAPGALAARAGSRYRALLDAEEEVRRGLWSDATWRRLRVERGRLFEADGSAVA